MSLHKVTRKVIVTFFAIHASFYDIFFVQMDIFWETIPHSNTVVSIISTSILFTIVITASESFRRRYYWLFYKLHIIGSAIVLPLLFFHVNHIRIYLLESAAVLIMTAVFRILRS
jgi:hypothetical protein